MSEQDVAKVGCISCDILQKSLEEARKENEIMKELLGLAYTGKIDGHWMVNVSPLIKVWLSKARGEG